MEEMIINSAAEQLLYVFPGGSDAFEEGHLARRGKFRGGL
jgi:hypothetical protein